MTARADALRRADFLACAAMLLSGISAVATMWTATGRALYPIAGVLLLAVGALMTRQVVRAQAATRDGAIARAGIVVAKVLACGGLAAACVMTGSLTAVGDNVRRPSTVTAVGAVLLVVQLVQMSTVASRRDVALGAPVVCALLAQAGTTATDASIVAPFAVSLAAMVAAVALVFRGELLDEATTVIVVRRGLGALASTARATGPPLARVGVAAAALFLLLPNSSRLHARPPAPRSSGSMALAAAAGTGGSVGKASGDPGPHSRAIADPGSGRLDLRVRGALGDVPIFAVDATSPPYWQGAIYDDYDGVGWTTTSGGGSSWSLDASTGKQQAPPDASQPTVGGMQRRADSVELLTSLPLAVVYAPGRPTGYVGPGRVSSDADGNARVVGAEPGPSSRPGSTYEVTSVQSLVSTPLSAAHGDDITDPRWTQLPAELPARVSALGRQIAGHAASRADVVDAVDNYLGGNETYDLDAPVPAAGHDAVDDFLFVSHRGFCEQFASAAVVLLRSAGIPARLVTGYSQGDITSDAGMRVMRGSDAHAWIQVWYPGVGWVADDPTASASLGHAGAGAGEGAGAGTAPATPAATATLSPSPSTPSASASAKSAAAGSARHDASLFGNRLLRGVAVLFAVIGGWLLLSLRSRRRRRGAPDERRRPQAGGPVLSAYLRLVGELTGMGRAPMPGETPREVVETLAAVATNPRAVDEAVHLLERECYGIEPLSSLEVATAVAVFDRLRESGAAVGSAVGP